MDEENPAERLRDYQRRLLKRAGIPIPDDNSDPRIGTEKLSAAMDNVSAVIGLSISARNQLIQGGVDERVADQATLLIIHSALNS